MSLACNVTHSVPLPPDPLIDFNVPSKAHVSAADALEAATRGAATSVSGMAATAAARTRPMLDLPLMRYFRVRN